MHVDASLSGLQISLVPRLYRNKPYSTLPQLCESEYSHSRLTTLDNAVPCSMYDVQFNDPTQFIKL